MTLRTAGIGALLVSIGAGMTSNVLFLAASQFRVERLREPTRMLSAGTTSAELFRWAAALDLIGYYLATAVLAYVLWQQLRPRNPVIADLSAIAAFGYALAGGVGAAVLAIVAPMLMRDYTAAEAADQALIATQFATLFEVVWRAVWQLLDAILLAVWWLGLGLLLWADRPGLCRLSIVLASGAAVGAIATLLGLDPIRDAMLAVVFALWAAWLIWLLVLFVRYGRTD